MRVHVAPLALLLACAPPAEDATPAQALPVAQAAPPLRLLPRPYALVPGHTTRFQLQGGTPGQTARLVASLNLAGAVACPPPLAGACLDLANPVSLIGQQPVAVGGTAVFPVRPPSAPPGVVAVQAIEGLATSRSAVAYLPLLDADGDADGDGLPSGAEVDLGFEPLFPDSDRDGIPDGEEACALSIDPAGIDRDTDGWGVPCDCDDTNERISPGLPEVPYDGIDNDCDALTFDDDLDRDGFGIDDDCDDTRDDISPAEVEVPGDGLDNDCDALTPDVVCPLTSTSPPIEGVGLAGITAALNDLRLEVGVAEFTWSELLAREAQAHATSMATACMLAPAIGISRGQTLFSASGATLRPPETVVAAWGCQRYERTFGDGAGTCNPIPIPAGSSCTRQGICSSYTQIVWSTTTQVGCGVAVGCNTQYWACFYNPPGGFLGVPPYPAAQGDCLDLDHDDVVQPFDADDEDAFVQ